ncbi:MAG: UDP-N-acetylglucosamine--N-acetylmuramyl-(pentapeptide) pyrophosphoryl-undecaprenol N-acetylglucosamine transferase [Phycisphaerae bacterium]|jgi:UDP-N-acetylglucosamine--N-acetylmuramyl-(pentapeptide) pyrophosphoryl-undecaprenol N-acetylglucosamine transferase
MSGDCYVFVGGGTGGHLFPGIAVAQCVRSRDPAARIIFLTTDRPLDRELLRPTGFEQIEQPVRPFSGNPLNWPAFWLAWRRSVSAAAALLRRVRPAAVLGLGGYAAGPAVVAARRLGVPAAILNPDAIPGRANRYLATRSDLVVLQWDASRPHFPLGVRAVTLGCPIRAEFASRAALLDEPHQSAGSSHDAIQAARIRFGLDPLRPTLLVTGASQGARTVNQATLKAWPSFVSRRPDWQLLHLTGSTGETATRDGYRAAGVPATVLAFTHEMVDAITAADAVVSRAGASTLAELTALGRASVLLPYPYHKDRHQHANARVLTDAGAALLLEDCIDPQRNAGPLCEALDRLACNETRRAMSVAARRLGRPDAAERVADWMIIGARAVQSGPRPV